MEAMWDLWERSERSTCTHPGWATLRGWGPIAASFFAMFQAYQGMQFVLTEERAQVVGDVAWVTVEENLLGEDSGDTVAGLNIFVRFDGVRGADHGWRLVCHHGSIVDQALAEEGRRPA